MKAVKPLLMHALCIFTTDQIDAIGDKAVTENQTFEACSDGIKQIKLLVERIINKLNGNRILVTADHGFLFKSSDVVESDKTALTVKPHGTVEGKKRYLIGQQLPKDSFYWTGDIAVTANLSSNSDQAEFMILVVLTVSILLAVLNSSTVALCRKKFVFLFCALSI